MSSKNGRSIRAIDGGGYGVCASTDGPTRPLVVVLGRRHANFTSNAIAEYHPGCVRPHSRLEYSRCKRRGFNKFKTRICSSTTIDTVVFCNAARVRSFFGSTALWLPRKTVWHRKATSPGTRRTSHRMPRRTDSVPSPRPSSTPRIDHTGPQKDHRHILG